ncbi:MAG TPA: hypothetical protein VHP83_03385 [Aggregatilineaceae bacterium]|nr:hypothetical protein [Aggregatilineaceae bacterium]
MNTGYRGLIVILVLGLALAGSASTSAQGTYDYASITADVGRYDFLTPNTAEPRVFLVQENHVYVSGQVESAVMIHRLIRDYGLTLIGTEGAFPNTPFDTNWFNAGMTPSQVRNQAVELLGEGEISQSELAAIVYPNYAGITIAGDFSVFGIDDAAYYAASDLSDEVVGEFDIAMLYTAIAMLDTAGQDQILDLFDRMPETDGPELDVWREELLTLVYANHPDQSIRDWYATTIPEMAPCMSLGVADEIAYMDVGLQIIQAHLTTTESSWGISLAEMIDHAMLEREFYVSAHEREITMVYELEGWLEDHPDQAILSVIGAAHTGWMEQTLEADGYSTVVLSSESLCDPSVAIGLSDEAYVSKTLGQSVDTFSGLGGLLSGSIKPGIVLDQPWFQADSESRKAALLVTEGLRANPNATLQDIFAGVPFIAGIAVDLNSWQPVSPGRGVFSININITGIPIDTIHVGVLTDFNQSEPDDLDLETLLLRELDQLRDRGEPQHADPTTNLTEVAPNVSAIFGADQNTVINAVKNS